MPQFVDVQDIGLVSFPDEATPDEIAATLNRDFPKQPTVPSESPKPSEVGTARSVIGSVARGFSQNASGLLKAIGEGSAALGRLTGVGEGDPAKLDTFRAGQALQSGTEALFPVNPEAAQGFWTGDVPQGLGQVAGLVAGAGGVKALVQKGLGALGEKTAEKVATRAAVRGALTAGGASEFDDAYQRSIDRGDSPDLAASKAAGYAVISTAIESKLGVGRVLKRFGIDEPTTLKAIEKAATGSLAKTALKEGIAGLTEEGLQRSFQDYIVDGQLDWNSIAREGGAGGVVQALLGMAGHAAHRSSARKSLEWIQEKQRTGITQEEARANSLTPETLSELKIQIKGPPNTPDTLSQRSSEEQKLPRIPTRENLPPDVAEVQQGESTGSDAGGRIVGATTIEEAEPNATSDEVKAAKAAVDEAIGVSAISQGEAKRLRAELTGLVPGIRARNIIAALKQMTAEEKAGIHKNLAVVPGEANLGEVNPPAVRASSEPGTFISSSAVGSTPTPATIPDETRDEKAARIRQEVANAELLRAQEAQRNLPPPVVKESLRPETPVPATPELAAGKPAAVSGVPELIVENGTIPTVTGRRIPAPPAIRTDTNRKATSDVKKVDAWLIEQAKAEAAARNDEFNGLQFSQMKVGKLSQADKDSANQYLFGHESPTIIQPAATPAPPSPPATEVKAKVVKGEDFFAMAGEPSPLPDTWRNQPTITEYAKGVFTVSVQTDTGNRMVGKFRTRDEARKFRDDIQRSKPAAPATKVEAKVDKEPTNPAESQIESQLKDADNFTGKAANEAEKSTVAWATHVEDVVNPLKAKIRKIQSEVGQMAVDASRTKPEAKGKRHLTKKAFLTQYGVALMDEANAIYKQKNAEWSDLEKQLEAAEEKRKELEAAKERRFKEWSSAATRAGELRRQIYPKAREGDISSKGTVRESKGEVVSTPISEQDATRAVVGALGVTELPVNIRFTNNAEDPSGRVVFLKGFLPQIELNLAKIGSAKQLVEILHEELIHPLQQDPEFAALFDAIRPLVTAADEQLKRDAGYSFETAPEEAVNEVTRQLVDRNIFQRLIDWITRKVKELFKIQLNPLETARAAARNVLQEAVKNKVSQTGGERFSGGPGVKSKVFDDYFYVTDRLQLTPELHDAAQKRAFDLLTEAGFKDLEPIGYMWKLRPDAEQNQEFDGPGTFDHEIEAKHLIEILRRELAKGRETAPELPHLLDSIRTQFAGDNVTSISRPTRDELVSLAQGEVSLKGLALGMHAANAPNVERVGRNIGQALQQVYSDRFGGDRIRAILREAVEVFRSFLSPEQIKTALEGHPNAIEILNQIFTLNLRDTSNRIARRVDARLKKKRKLTQEQKQSAAREDEAVNAIIEEAKRNTIDPVTGEVIPGIKEVEKNAKLEPDERLGHMTNPKTQAKIQLAIETAIQAKELETGIKATIDAETDPQVKAEMRASSDLIEPTPEMIEEGMKRPEYAHWRKVRHDLLNYSPTTIKLVQDVIKGRFSGTRFNAIESKPEDLRIDLAKLAVSSDAEVERVFAAQLGALESVMDVNGATPATKARILETLRKEMEAQLEQARQKIQEPLFKSPILPGKPLTPEQRIRQLLNAKLFSNPQLNIPGTVDRLAYKSALTKLVPSAAELVKQVFATPYSKQSELSERFANTLVDQLGVSAEQRVRAKQVFDATFKQLFEKARDKAKAKFLDALTPFEVLDKTTNRKSPWKLIEEGVNSGEFNASDTMDRIADANGWKRLTPEIAARMRSWVEQMQHLREVPEAWLKKANGKEAEIARLKVQWESSHRQEMVELKRQIETMWARLTVPLNIRTSTPNIVQAAYEWSSAVLLLKFGFPTRQFIDVFFQGLIHGPTRSMQLTWDNVKRNVANGQPREAWAEFSTAFISGAKVQAQSYRQALAVVQASLKETPRARNVEDLISRVALFESATQKMEEFRQEGKTVQASILWLFTQVRWGRQIAAALDNLSSIPATYQEMRQQAVATLRANGMNRAQAETQADSLMGNVNADWMNAIETARSIAVLEGKTQSESQLKQSAADIVEGMIYQRMREASLPADDFEARNAVNKEVWGWNRKEEGGPGGFVAAPMRYASRLGENWWPAAVFGVTLGRFSNAIANAGNIAAMFTPLGHYPDLFGVHVSGPNKNVDDKGVLIEGSGGSNWMRTPEDRVQRKIWATIGSSLGTVTIGMVALGLVSVRWRPPKDPKEREEWYKLHRAGTVEFNLPDGTFIPVSLTVGPLRPLAPYFVGAGAWKEKADAVVKQQAALDAEALKTGIPAGKAKELDSLDYLAIAGQAAWGALVGGRTATGMIGSLTDYGIPNVAKLASSPVSAMLPPLPAYQEIMRASGVYLDARTASFFDYLVPTPSSSGAAVNMLGDTVNSDNALRRVIQIATGGSYPYPVSDAEAKSSVAYANLFATEVRPSSISLTKGYNFNGTMRPMTRDELAQYARLRGSNLKESLMAMGPVDGMNPSDAKTAVQAAIKAADQQALTSMGVAVKAPKQTSSSSTTRRGFGRRTRLMRPSRGGYRSTRIKRFKMPSFTGSRSKRRSSFVTKRRRSLVS